MDIKRGYSRGVRAIAGMAVLLGMAALAQAQNCSNATWTGTHFFLISGTGPNSARTATVPYAQLGKLVSDGNGNLTGTATESAGGVILHLTLTGTYTVNADCTGTQTLTITPQGSASFVSTSAIELVDGGQQKITATETSGTVMIGRAYRAFAESPAVCGNYSLIGSYGFAGASPALGAFPPFSASGGETGDGKGNFTYNFTINDGQGTPPVSGNATYLVNSDCSGVATALGATKVDDFAIIEGGAVLNLSADTGRVFYGVAQPESTPLLLPQLAFGGGWYTALYFTNPTGGAVSFPVTFTTDNGTPLAVPSLGGSTTTVNIPAKGTTIVELPNSGPLAEGYASFTMPPGVSGYGVFRQSVTGRLDQEAVVPFTPANLSQSTLIWDDTTTITALAIVNASGVAATISVTLLDNNGNVAGTSSVSLPPHQKTETQLRLLPTLSGIVGMRGRAFFAATAGNVAVLGLRFGGTAFTSIPAN